LITIQNEYKVIGEHFDFCMCNPPFFEDVDVDEQGRKKGKNIREKKQKVIHLYNH